MIVMSCHVMSCRHCCINSKKSFSKTFSLHKIIYKYFAGFLACIKSSLRGYCRSNPLYLDCHAFARNDEKNIVITREWNDRSNLFYVDCFAHASTRCAPRGDDDNKNFQFDKFQRLFSVIYKKNLLIKEISK